ncbi:hypothetical protein TeGR_g12682, partial [Tetraparma gracilis]
METSTLTDCRPQIAGEICAIEQSSLQELSSIISESTAVELEEARQRVKDQQLGATGLALFTGFVSREKKVVAKFRARKRLESETKLKLSEAILYEGKAAAFEAPPPSLPIRRASDAGAEKERRLAALERRRLEEQERRKHLREEVAQYYEEKKEGKKGERKSR